MERFPFFALPRAVSPEDLAAATSSKASVTISQSECMPTNYGLWGNFLPQFPDAYRSEAPFVL